MVRVLYSVQITGNEDSADELEGAFIVSGGTSTTLGEVKAAWPFAGQFYFRVKLLQHGEQEGWVWLDLRDDAEVLPLVSEGEVCVKALSSHFLRPAGEEPAGISPEQHAEWRLCYAAAGEASLPTVASTSMWTRLTGGASGPSTPLPDASSSPAMGEYSEEDGSEGEDLRYGSGEGSGSRGEGSTALDEARVKAKAALASAKESAKGFFGRAWKAADNLSQRVAEKLEAQAGERGTSPL